MTLDPTSGTDTVDTGASSRSFVVGIAGGSASGKTTFTTGLIAAMRTRYPDLKIELMGLDRYFYRGAPGGPRFISPSSGEELPDNNHPNSADNARFVADLDAFITQPGHPDVVVVEGLMVLHLPEIRERLDLRIFMDLEADIRALRRLLRDMNGGRGSTDPAWIATYYRECARVGHNKYVEPSRVFADLTLRGDSDFTRITPYVIAAIYEGLQSSSFNSI